MRRRRGVAVSAAAADCYRLPMHDDPTDAPPGGGSSPQPTSGDLARVARLARLALGPDALEAQRPNLLAVLGHIGRLFSVDVSSTEPLHQVMPQGNRLDEDREGPTLSQESLLAIAPLAEGPFIAVPKVLADAS